MRRGHNHGPSACRNIRPRSPLLQRHILLRLLRAFPRWRRWRVRLGRVNREGRDMSLHLAKPQHEGLYQDLCKLVSKHADKLTAQELLAVAANMLGKLVAMQD